MYAEPSTSYLIWGLGKHTWQHFSLFMTVEPSETSLSSLAYPVGSLMPRDLEEQEGCCLADKGHPQKPLSSP